MRIMASTIKEIANVMKAEFVMNETLCEKFGLTYDVNRSELDRVPYYDEHFSAVSVETCLIYIVATCAVALEHMMDWFKADVDEIVANERYGHKGWYESTAKGFHYTDPNTQEEVYPITHASCEELNFGVKLKVAKGEPGSMEPLEQDETAQTDEYRAFKTHMSRVKPAGMPIDIVSIQPDALSVELVVYYDPIVFLHTDVDTAVEETITSYLQSIEFNGVFTTMEMVDALQRVDGLNIVEVTAVQAKYGGNSYANIEHHTRYVPVSGYMVLDRSELQITTVPNV